ncbi:unnamed protein product, partial [Allacma fusca]
MEDGNYESNSDDEDECPCISVYQKVKTAVRKIKKCEKLEESLRHFCANLQINYLKLIKDMPVRWNTSYLMFERYLRLRPAIEKTLSSDSSLSKLVLCDDECMVLQQFITFLKPFYEMTNIISVQLTPTLSLTAAVYIELY